ncbi:MAG: CoA-binding protein [Planctomycetes bacterium]|nr:CoA-binding protein [Planctomycetota bacterium]MBI3834525.1 CoA-binding protein [Planctomycetota bacterium]
MSKKKVAIVGASADRSKYGNKSVRAHLDRGWEVYPVNPKGGEIDGLHVFASLEEIYDPIDRVSLYLPSEVGMAALPAIARLRPAEFFVNPGAESEELVDAARKLGLDPILACSIVDLGVTPAAFPG